MALACLLVSAGAEWRRHEVAVEDAAAYAAEIDARYDDARLRTLIDGLGWAEAPPSSGT